MARFVISSAAVSLPSVSTTGRAVPSSLSSASRGRAPCEDPEPGEVARHHEGAVRHLKREVFVLLGLDLCDSQASRAPPRGLASVDELTFVLARLRHPDTPELVRVGARQSCHLVPGKDDGLCPPSEWSPSCDALLLLPSWSCSHTRCLFSNISPTEGRGCCGNCCRLSPIQFPSLASLQVTTIPRVQGDPLWRLPCCRVRRPTPPKS